MMSKPQGRGRTIALGLSAVSFGLISLAGCGSENDGMSAVGAQPADQSTALEIASQPAGTSAGREPYRVSSLEEFVQSSDLVFVGTVTGVRPGRIVGDAADSRSGAIQFRAVTIQVEDLIKGADISTVLLEEIGIENGKAISLNHAAFANVGDRIIVGVRPKQGDVDKGSKAYVQTSTQTRFYVQQDGSVRGPYLDERNEDDPFTVETSKLTAEEIISRLRAAAATR